jgi:hypothetical protein
MPKVQRQRARRDVNKATLIVDRDDMIDTLAGELEMLATTIEFARVGGIAAEAAARAKMLVKLVTASRRRG